MHLILRCCGLFVVGLFIVQVAQACSCARPPSPREALEAADAVFVGRVVKTERDAEGINEGSLFATMEIDLAWKGDVGRRLVVGTAPNSAMCGFPFREGISYIVYAHLRDDGALRVNSCSRSATLENAEEDLEDLNDLLDDDDGGMCGGPSNIAAGQAMLFVFLAMALRYRRRRYNRASF